MRLLKEVGQGEDIAFELGVNDALKESLVPRNFAFYVFELNGFHTTYL